MTSAIMWSPVLTPSYKCFQSFNIDSEQSKLLSPAFQCRGSLQSLVYDEMHCLNCTKLVFFFFFLNRRASMGLQFIYSPIEESYPGIHQVNEEIYSQISPTSKLEQMLQLWHEIKDGTNIYYYPYDWDHFFPSFLSILQQSVISLLIANLFSFATERKLAVFIS